MIEGLRELSGESDNPLSYYIRQAIVEYLIKKQTLRK